MYIESVVNLYSHHRSRISCSFSLIFLPCAGFTENTAGLKSGLPPSTATSGILPAVPEDESIASSPPVSSRVAPEIVPAENDGLFSYPGEIVQALGRAHEGVNTDSIASEPLGPPTPDLAPESRYLVTEPDNGVSDLPAAADVFPSSTPITPRPAAPAPRSHVQEAPWHVQDATSPSVIRPAPGAARELRSMHVGPTSLQGFAEEESQLFKDQTLSLVLVSVSLFAVTFRHEAAEAAHRAASAVSEGGWVAGAMLCFFLAVLPWVVKVIVGIGAAIRFAHNLESNLEVRSRASSGRKGAFAVRVSAFAS
jgi:hypothetical protein